jgi:hypothetical protein
VAQQTPYGMLSGTASLSAQPQPQTKPVYYPPHYRPRRTAKGFYKWNSCERFDPHFEQCLVVCFVCDAEGTGKQVRAVDQQLHLLQHGVSLADYVDLYGDNGRFQHGLICEFFAGLDD